MVQLVSFVLIDRPTVAFIYELHKCLGTIFEPLSVGNHNSCTVVVTPVDVVTMIVKSIRDLLFHVA